MSKVVFKGLPNIHSLGLLNVCTCYRFNGTEAITLRCVQLAGSFGQRNLANKELAANSYSQVPGDGDRMADWVWTLKAKSLILKPGKRA